MAGAVRHSSSCNRKKVKLYAGRRVRFIGYSTIIRVPLPYQSSAGILQIRCVCGDENSVGVVKLGNTVKLESGTITCHCDYTTMSTINLRSIAIAFISEATLFIGAAGAAPPQPNIVFIFSDDHGYQAISAYGDSRRLLETPAIDRLAKEGLRFDRCLVPNSICGPSRATVLTGKYSHRNGFYNNTNSRFDGSQTTFPKLLQAAGYQTAIVGKWHLVSDPTGFDYWEILPGQGVYYNPPMIRNGQRVKHEGYVTDIITGISLDWLQKRDKSKPFLLMCHHKAPH